MEVAKVKELYEYVAKLMEENKGECPVCVNSVNCDDSFEVVTPKWEGQNPFEFDENKMWIQVISNRNDCPCCECDKNEDCKKYEDGCKREPSK